MPQIFRPRADTIFRLVIVSIFGGAVLLAIAGESIKLSAYVTGVGVPIQQPVPFSHQHHVGGLGLDCRYCHTSVELSSFAGMPSTKTCMTCHSQIWTNAEILEPVRESYETGTPIQWQRIYRLPDFVYFNHGIHVRKGVDCFTCHGRVDRMPLMWAARRFYMQDCLACHQEPERYQVQGKVQGRERLTDCYVCHR